jgi:hypothetical protein
MIIPYSYTHFRTWDFHTSVPNPILFVSLSLHNEAFLWDELNIDPKRNTTLIICEAIAEMSGDFKYRLNTIDPLASENQPNTNTSVLKDVNDYFKIFKSDPRMACTGGRWEGYDTKYHAAQTGFLRGRDQIKQRLLNASLCKVPFNNKVVKDGESKYLPTLWIFNHCRQTLNAIYRWRMEKGKPSQKWSHHCTALEGLMKDHRFKPKVDYFPDDLEIRRQKNQRKQLVGYFKKR